MVTQMALTLLVASLATASATFSDKCQRYSCPNVTETDIGIPSTVLRTMDDDTTWAATSSTSGRRGMFRKLFQYIRGANEESLEMDMTIPVPRKFTTLPGGEVQQTMSFFIDVASPPLPTSAAVRLETLAAGTEFYVRSFTTQRPSGMQGRSWGKGKGRRGGRRGQRGQRGQGRPELPAEFTNRYAANLDSLQADLTAQGLTFDTTVYYNVGYSAPWTWPKYEEVWVEKIAA